MAPLPGDLGALLTKSQSYRVVGVGRDLWIHLVQPLLKKGHLHSVLGKPMFNPNQPRDFPPTMATLAGHLGALQKGFSSSKQIDCPTWLHC